MTHRIPMIRTAAALAALAAFGACTPGPKATVAESDIRKLYPPGKIYDCAAAGMPDMRYNFENTASPGFGCAHQSNYAAMVVDPNDLHRARPMTPPDRAARERVIDAYRDGKDTAVNVRAKGTDSLVDTE